MYVPIRTPRRAAFACLCPDRGAGAGGDPAGGMDPVGVEEKKGNFCRTADTFDDAVDRLRTTGDRGSGISAGVGGHSVRRERVIRFFIFL